MELAPNSRKFYILMCLDGQDTRSKHVCLIWIPILFLFTLLKVNPTINRDPLSGYTHGDRVGVTVGNPALDTDSCPRVWHAAPRRRGRP